MPALSVLLHFCPVFPAILLFAVAASAIAGTIAGTVLGATVTYSIMQDLQGHVSTVRSATMMVKAYVTFNARRAPGSFKVAFGAHEDEFEDYGHFPLLEIGPMDVSSWTGKGVTLKPTMDEGSWKFANASQCARRLYTVDSPPVVLTITTRLFRWTSLDASRCSGKLTLLDSSNHRNSETHSFMFLPPYSDVFFEGKGLNSSENHWAFWDRCCSRQ